MTHRRTIGISAMGAAAVLTLAGIAGAQKFTAAHAAGPQPAIAQQVSGANSNVQNVSTNPNDGTEAPEAATEAVTAESPEAATSEATSAADTDTTQLQSGGTGGPTGGQ